MHVRTLARTHTYIHTHIDTLHHTRTITNRYKHKNRYRADCRKHRHSNEAKIVRSTVYALAMSSGGQRLGGGENAARELQEVAVAQLHTIDADLFELRESAQGLKSEIDQLAAANAASTKAHTASKEHTLAALEEAKETLDRLAVVQVFVWIDYRSLLMKCRALLTEYIHTGRARRTQTDVRPTQPAGIASK